ncbi:MAG: sugar phosphorylase, partial [Isosphaeraceae bacterium]
MTLNEHQIARLRGRLAELYGDQADACLARLLTLVSHHPSPGPRHTAGWDQRDVLLVCYGDQVQAPGRPHLQTLLDFLTAYDLPRSLRQLHLLPFFPSSSDDGFAVIDYRAVDPELGTWNDISELGHHFGLMFDLVINHVSVSSLWFQNYVKGEPPYDRFFLEVDPGADLSRVVRPRSQPLLTSVPTDRGVRHVWMTFSADQVDLDYHNPDVLLEMIGVLLFYLQRGARLIRLDAIAYLWKELGTSCIHLRPTHVVVKLLRDLVDAVAPGTLLITETNVPHAENVSYFGDGDEAHLVYQFSLPPLLLEAFVSEDATVLCDWLERLEPARPGTTYLNFTASHDGIGVRPLEGLLPAERIARLVDAVRQRGGLVSTRRLANGEDAPYELNTTYFDALRNPADADPQWHVRRFLASQAIMLALRGIPAVYFHSLIGTANDSGAVTATGRARSINRRKYAADELGRILAKPNSVSA